MMPLSTRRQTRLSGRYVRSTAGSQSLERGLQLLRAFRPGNSVLGNAELAARTGLARPTVSRLTRSLVEQGFLAYDHDLGGYRLAPVCLSLALNYRAASTTLEVAMPLMRTVAEKRRVNVGLATLDQGEMVYLDSIRLARGGISRRVGAGTRIPVATTALGRACMTQLPAQDRKALFSALATEHGSEWAALRRAIEEATRQLREHGYCWAQWQPRILSVATPLMGASREPCSLNISLATGNAPLPRLIVSHGAALMKLREDIERQLQA